MAEYHEDFGGWIMPKAPVDGSILWRLLWRFAWILRPFLCKLRVDGINNVPVDRGFVLVSNHFAGLDTVVKGYACPRQIHYMAKKELFEINAFAGRFFRAFGVFPIARGRVDLHALQVAMTLVESGHVVGIYPEGTRSRTGKLGRGKSGAARIAMAADVPVVPVMSLGGQHLFSGILKWGRPTITVRFGAPLRLSGDANKSADARRETRRVMVAIAELLPPECRGVYADAFSEAHNTRSSETISDEMDANRTEEMAGSTVIARSL